MPDLEHETSSMGEDGLFRPTYLNQSVMEYWLKVDPSLLVEFAKEVRSFFVDDADGVMEQHHNHAPVTGDAEDQTELEAEALGSIGQELVALAAAVAGRLSFGGDLRVACAPLADRGTPAQQGHWLRDAEIYVVRLSLPHEPLAFAVAVFDGNQDPVIWTFEFEGRALKRATDVV